jgi:MerR family transcriptional regulator, copper efflux regulator
VLPVLIGEIVQRSGIGVHTIRFYEKMGLIADDSVRRLPNNYRDYGERVLETLRFIRYGQTIGFSLKEMADLMRQENLVDTPRKRQLELLETKLVEIDARLRETKMLRKMIAGKIQRIQEDGPGTRGTRLSRRR